MTTLITPIYAAVLALLFAALSIRTIALRRRLQVAIGDAGNKTMLRAVRVHANFAEYVPFTLLLTLMLELQRTPAALVHALGACLLIGRSVHAYGVSQTPETFAFRVAGMMLTLTALIGSALALLLALSGTFG